jgi:flagellar basal body P-ring protein FlgI
MKNKVEIKLEVVATVSETKKPSFVNALAKMSNIESGNPKKVKVVVKSKNGKKLVFKNVKINLVNQ